MLQTLDIVHIRLDKFQFFCIYWTPHENPRLSRVALLLHVGPKLDDGRTHAEGAHRHRQLVDRLDVARAGVEVEALAELCGRQTKPR